MTTRKISQKLPSYQNFPQKKKKMGIIRYSELFQLCTIFYYILNKLLFFFFFIYIDAVIFYNLFFQQNQTMKVYKKKKKKLSYTKPILAVLSNFTKIKDSSIESICSSFRTLTFFFFFVCFVISFFFFFNLSKAYIQFTHNIVFLTCCVGVTLHP